MKPEEARWRVGPGLRGQVLVERDRELAVLYAALRSAAAGAGDAVLLEGEAGLGKSRLLAEAVKHARVREMQVLRARALEPEGGFPFAVALQLLEAPLAAADASEREALLAGAAGLARGLLTGSHVDHEPASSEFSILHGLYWVVVNLAQRGPTLLCVDDLQWSDEASLRFLLYLAGRLDELPVALAVAGRPGAAGDDGETLAALRAVLTPNRVSLRGLGSASVGTLVRDSFELAETEFCAVCADVSSGNPFRLRELLLTLADDGVAPTAASVDRVRMLSAALLGRAAVFRLVRLGADAIALARAIAVLGDGAPLRRAAALAQLDLERAAVAADALAAEEILSADTLAFAHPLTREEVYAEAPPRQRGIAHLRAARLLYDEQATPEQVASQLLLAPPSGEDWVVGVLCEAARRSRAQGAPESAARYLARALHEPPAIESRCGVLVALGDAEAMAGIDSAVGHLTTALELQTDPVERAATARLLGRALGGLGRAPEAAGVLERALDKLSQGDDATHLLLADYLTNAVFEPGLRQRAFDYAAPLLRSPPRGSTAAQRALLAALAMRSGQLGAPVGRTIQLAARAWGDGALLRAEGPDGPGWLMVVWALALAEDYERARAVTAATIDAARRVGSLHAFANASYFHGDSCYRQGRLSEAQADAEQAIETARSGWQRYLVAALVLKANVLIERGDLQAAADTLAEADEYEQHAMLEVAWRLHGRGRLDFACGRPEEALSQFEAAGHWVTERLSAQHTVLPWRSDAARAALALGDRARARELVAPVLEHARQTGTGVLYGRRLLVLGLIEGGEAGIELLTSAVASLADSQASLEHAYALADLGSALRRAGRRTDARVRLREGLDLAHRLGADALAERARQELLATGARPRRALITGTDSLTPSERRVAELAAQGLTNPRIAQSLFVTPKTVEFHLRHVYQKLAITGRGGLAAALRSSEPA